ncbi:MAG: SAF domain-containing protein, partial [Micropruina sp.]
PAPVRARRNPRWIAAGVLAICLGGLGSGVLYTSVADARSVVRTNRTIFRGEVIKASDLGVVSIGSAQGIPTIPGNEAGALVGKTALTDLASGSLVPPNSAGEADVPAGTVRLGLNLAPGRLPVSALPSGTPVLLVAISKDGDGTAPGAPSVQAQIATSPTSLPDGSSLLDVSVPAAEGERIARLAAAGLVVLVRKAGS